MCEEMQVPFLGSVPLDPRIAKCCDEGKSFLEEFPDSPATLAISNILKSNFKQFQFLTYNFRSKGRCRQEYLKCVKNVIVNKI